jgi:hypothetical protein
MGPAPSRSPNVAYRQAPLARCRRPPPTSPRRGRAALGTRFGSWDAALRAPGYGARWRGHTPDELIAALTREADMLGRPPTQHEWATGSPDRPNATSVARAFGSWAAGLRAAGLEPPPTRSWSDGELVEALKAWTARHGRPPLSSDWQHAAPDHPTAAVARRRFGSWRAALNAAGVAR